MICHHCRFYLHPAHRLAKGFVTNPACKTVLIRFTDVFFLLYRFVNDVGGQLYPMMSPKAVAIAILSPHLGR